MAGGGGVRGEVADTSEAAPVNSMLASGQVLEYVLDMPFAAAVDPIPLSREQG